MRFYCSFLFLPGDAAEFGQTVGAGRIGSGQADEFQQRRTQRPPDRAAVARAERHLRVDDESRVLTNDSVTQRRDVPHGTNSGQIRRESGNPTWSETVLSHDPSTVAQSFLCSQVWTGKVKVPLG